MADKEIVDKAISDLTQALQITNEDLFVLEQGGEAKKLKGSQVVQYAKDSVAAEVQGVKEYADSAKASADAAAASATGVDEKVQAAQTAATNAANSETAAKVAQAAAEDAQQAAETAKAGAESEKTAAETARDTAGASAVAAAGSAAAAQEKAAEAARSAAAAAEAAAMTANQPINQITGADVGQIIKVLSVGEDGKPTSYETVKMPGHWETVLDTVWEQDVINPTAFNSETGIFTCAEGELDNLELNTEYAFFQQCALEGVAYNTILNNENLKVTKLSDTTFSIDATPPATFVPTNVKFSKGACLVITDIDARKIRLTLDGQFKPTATLYDRPFYGMNAPYFGRNVGYQQIRNAYQAYQQVTAEVESPYRIVGEILCGFNAPSNINGFHFKNNSFCCPLVPSYNQDTRVFSSDGQMIKNLYSTSAPHHLGGTYNNVGVLNDFLKIISGTKVKLERWVE